MKRYDIINHLIKVNNYKSFLEIGTQNQINFGNVGIEHKVCVDPDPYSSPTYLMTSDDFFKIIKSMPKENIFIISHKGDILFDKFTNIIRFDKEHNFTRLQNV
mgnify:CR=1 FL=1